MSVTLTTPNTINDSCPFDDCLITGFIKGLFAKIHGAKSEYNFTIVRHAALIKDDLASLGADHNKDFSFGYLNAMEAALPEAEFRYVAIHKNNKPLLIAYFQLYTLTSKNFNFDQNKGVGKTLVKFFLDLKKARILVSGNAVRNETAAFIYDKTILSEAIATQGFIAAAEKVAADECPLAVVLRDVPVSQFLLDRGYQQPWEDEVMNMSIAPNWTYLQDYINDLTRKYKARANKAIEACKPLRVAQLTESQVAEHAGTINELFNSLTRQQSFVLTEPAANYITVLKKLYKNDFEVFGFFEGDKLVAFYSGFVTSDCYEMYYVGFDYTLNSQYQLYFNMLFSGLERAIVLGKTTLKLGRTSFDAKASLGATAAGLNSYIKMVHLSDFVLRRFINYFSSMEDKHWKQRNPLKNAQPTVAGSEL